MDDVGACASGAAAQREPRLSPEDHICFRTPQRTVTVPVRDLILLKAESDFTRIFLKSSPPLLICALLGQYEKLLPSPPFTRLDRSLILNLQSTLNLKRKSRDKACLILEGVQEEFPLGRTAQMRLFERLGSAM